MINLGGKKVAKMLVGSSVIYQDSDGWIPLELPDRVTGQVMFKDNGDGTASLSGSISVNDYGRDRGYYPIVLAPEGYQFTDVNSWNQAAGGMRICEYSDRSIDGNRVSWLYTPVKIINGDINREFMHYVADTIYYIHFTANGTLSGSESAAPAVVGIAKV